MERQLHTDRASTALSSVVVAGQQLLLDRVDLAVEEMRIYMARSGTDAALVAFGGIILLGALVALDMALIDVLLHSLTRPAALLCCAGVHAVGGSVLLSVGLRRGRNA